MKLQRIVKVRNHRIFKDFAWPAALYPFATFNLIYGWNGSGKTTLSNLFRLIELRSALGEGEVTFEFDGGRFNGSDFPTANLPNIRVFNRDTVSRSIFENPSTSQLPPVFVIGEENVEKQKQIDSLKDGLPAKLNLANSAAQGVVDAERKLSAFAINKAREIKNLLLGPGSNYNNYNIADFRSHIASFEVADGLSLNDATRSQLLELKSAAPKDPVSLPLIVFPDLLKLHAEAREILSKSIVSNALNELVEDPAVASWVASGLNLHTKNGDADTCKFCAQPLQTDRLRRLEGHFNNKFNEFSREIDSLQARAIDAAKALDGAVFPSGKLLYPELEAEYEREKAALLAILGNLKMGLTGLARAIQSKKQRMFESLSLDSLLTGGDGNYDREMSFVKAMLVAVGAGLPAISEFMGKSVQTKLQIIVDRHNAKTNAFHDEVKIGRDKLHAHELSQAISEWRELDAAKKAADAMNNFAASDLALVRKKISELEASVRQHRPMADKLNRDLIAYLGHDEVQVVAESTGYKIMRRGVPATDLSEGERTAIAFLHFLGSLSDQSFDVRTDIVIIDDPISSLDSNSIYSAFGFLKENLKHANQLFVLTHNFTFFKQVRNWFSYNKSKAHFYMLRCSMQDGVRCSRLELLDDFLKNHESEYQYLFKRVVEAADWPDGQRLETYYELPNLARRLLESYLVFKVPDESSLHARLAQITFDESRKAKVERFIQVHSHAGHIGEGNDEASALAEAPAVLRDLLAIIESSDASHFARMRASLVK